MAKVYQLTLGQLFVESDENDSVQGKTEEKATYQLLRSESGSTAIEYAIMLGLICTVILASVQTVGKNSAATIDKISTALRNAADEAPSPKERASSGPTGGTTK